MMIDRPTTGAQKECAATMDYKTNLIDAIQTHNPTADRSWLETFTNDSLRSYLDHLLSALEPRGSHWIRPGDTPAITTRAAA
jgi:hypothetical protein